MAPDVRTALVCLVLARGPMSIRRMSDGVMNGTETDVDCGGPSCPACGTSQACILDGDCGDAFCLNQQCSTCGDEVRNGFETDVTWWTAGPCREGQRCEAQLDCITACATVEGVGQCVERSCEDGLRNGRESDVDVVVLIVMGVETESAVMWLETVHPINAKTDAACPVPMAWSTELRAMWTVAAPAPPALLGRTA